MEVCMLIQHFNLEKLNGEENAVLNFCKALKKIGVSSSIIAQKGVQEFQEVDGIELYKSGDSPYSIGSLLKKIDLRKTHSFALTHSHEVSRAFLHGILKFNRPLIVHYHNPLSVLPEVAGRFATTLKRADRIFVPSHFVARRLADYSASIEDKIEVIYNGVDVNHFQRKKDFSVLKPYGITDDSEIVAFAGRCSPIKGILTLVKAIPEVVREVKNAKFIFVGVKPVSESNRNAYYQTIMAEVSRLGINGQCNFVPYVSQDELPFFYSRASVTVVPSLLEAFGLVAVESLSCETPVIASRVGGLPEIVDENVGSLFDVQDEHALASSIVRLLKDQHLRKKMSKASRKKAVEMFTWDASARKIKLIYQEISS